MNNNQIHIYCENDITEEVIEFFIDSYMCFKSNVMKNKINKDLLINSNFNELEFIKTLSNVELRIFATIYFTKREDSIRKRTNESNEDYFIRKRDLIIEKLAIILKYDSDLCSKPMFFKTLKRLTDEKVIIRSNKQSVYYINPYIVPVLTLEEFELFKLKVEDYLIDKYTTLVDIPQPL